MNTQLMPVPFHGDTVVLVGKDNEPLVAMKPLVVNLGLDWKGQHAKLSEKFSSVMEEISTTGGDGKQYGMTCIPLRKLAAWLYSISPNKVAPELRDKIIQYQEECDEVLWNYWSKGVAVRPGAVTIAQQIILSKHRLTLLKELMRSRNRSMRDLLGVEITNLSNAMGLPVPDLDALGTVEPPQADVVADFWGALLQLDTKGIAYNHSKDSQLIALNMPHLVELFAANGIQTIIGTEVTNALKRCTEPQFLGQKAVDSIIRKTTTKCWVFKKVAQTQTL
ncbi:phage antirepressor N-terminal domain-containing protein [Pseudomonas sp. MWU13-2100]|uniref:phage antirepressor N-terminal domain-containing protein n=1 Tax=Pseudomonas sp. MWU13-2100 TaxID=2935075 RepID=UPI00200BFB6C|nr:phage antirepressor N-terminal domain-containing protein [Pseudomonas sp. MWU13-2100]